VSVYACRWGQCGTLDLVLLVPLVFRKAIDSVSVCAYLEAGKVYAQVIACLACGCGVGTSGFLLFIPLS